MSLTLHFHPLSSFCHKVLIALYENETPFRPNIVDLMDPGEREAFRKLWPIGKFPVLQDDGRDRLVPESSLIIEYLGQHYPGAVAFIPQEPAAALAVRHWDRFFDLYVNEPMQKVVTDRLRPADGHDPIGVEMARGRLQAACSILERELKDKSWAAGDDFTMADCAAAPALFYADKVMPLSEAYPVTAAYFARLLQRPSYARVIEEAQPYFKLFPTAKD